MSPRPRLPARCKAACHNVFSVVIPVRNAEAYIGAQLDALAAQSATGDFEVIVVDNASTDRSVEIAERYARPLQLRVVSASGAQSASYARNIGIRESRGDIIVFLDADDVADPALIEAYRERREFPVLGGAYEERRLNDPRIAAWRYELTRNGLPIAFKTTSFFLMGNAAIHRSVFDAIGLFDESFTHGGEEVDFSIRAHLAGYTVHWVPEAIVYYRHRTTLRGLAEQWFDYGRATTAVYAKHRDRMPFPPTTVGDTVQAMRDVLPHVIDLAKGTARRGQWIRMSSFYAGETVESLHRRMWHLG